MLNPSILQPGQEQHEIFKSPINKKKYCQYDYRAPNGELFSTVAPTLDLARSKRDKWLEQKGWSA